MESFGLRQYLRDAHPIRATLVTRYSAGMSMSFARRDARCVCFLRPVDQYNNADGKYQVTLMSKFHTGRHSRRSNQKHSVDSQSIGLSDGRDRLGPTDDLQEQLSN